MIVISSSTGLSPEDRGTLLKSNHSSERHSFTQWIDSIDIDDVAQLIECIVEFMNSWVVSYAPCLNQAYYVTSLIPVHNRWKWKGWVQCHLWLYNIWASLGYMNIVWNKRMLWVQIVIIFRNSEQRWFLCLFCHTKNIPVFSSFNIEFLILVSFIGHTEK